LTPPHHQPGARLLLKSPVHTSRVGLLLQLFPQAQFVYLHRDPLTVRVLSKIDVPTTQYCL